MFVSNDTFDPVQVEFDAENEIFLSQTDIDKYESPDKVITSSLAGIPSISLWIQASLRGNRTPFVV